jgi:hypothetical protein
MKTNAGSRLIVLTLILMVGCIPILTAATFDYDRMDLGNNVSSGILPLEKLGGNLNDRQNNRIMQNGFLRSGSESYGYYRLTLSNQYIGAGKKDKSTLGWFIFGSIVTGGVGGLFLPVSHDRYALSAKLEFFSCEKEKIDGFESSDFFEVLDGSFYNDDYTTKTEAIYRRLLRDCLTKASSKADNINSALINAKYPPPPLVEIVTVNAFNELRNKIPKGSRLAVIGATEDSEVTLACFLIEKYFIENNTNRLQIVDRTSINMIIDEVVFSRTVFVTDAIRVGGILAADYIVYTNVTGEGSNRSLVFRVLSVRNSEVIANFISRFQG